MHFDHSGGLRTFVDAGAIDHRAGTRQAVFRKGLGGAAQRCVPTALASQRRRRNSRLYGDKYELSDGSRTIEIHRIAGSGHSDDLALVYLPKEKVLIEADAYTPTVKDHAASRADPL